LPVNDPASDIERDGDEREVEKPEERLSKDTVSLRFAC
jgi:hypothetical protein